MYQCVKFYVSIQEASNEEDIEFKMKATKQKVIERHKKLNLLMKNMG